MIPKRSGHRDSGFLRQGIRRAMKYLVTGATGLIGNNVVRQLLAAGGEVRALSRAGAECPPICDLDIEIVQGDVRDASVVRRAVQGIDVVIHAAAHVQVGWSHPELHQQVNVEGTRLVAEATPAADSPPLRSKDDRGQVTVTGTEPAGTEP